MIKVVKMADEAEKSRTENADDPVRTGGGPGGVENLADLAQEAAKLQQGEQQQQQAAVVQQQQAEQQQAEAGIEAAAQELAEVLKVGRDMAGDLLEASGKLPVGQFGEIWSDDKLLRIAGPLVRVIERHGGGLSALVEQFGPHLALAVAVIGPTVQTIKAVKAVQAAKPVVSDGQQQ